MDVISVVNYDLRGRPQTTRIEIESGPLMPKFRLGNAREPFSSAQITGTFRAVEDQGKVLRAVQILKTQFRQPLETGEP